MPIDIASILVEIDAVLTRYEEVEKDYCFRFQSYDGEHNFIKAPEPVQGEIITLLQATIDRLAPPKYGKKALATIPHEDSWESKTIRMLAGVLKSLRADYAAGRMQTFQERVHSDLFSDFLEMTEYLLEDEGLKDPAAVLAGGVLEEHLRQLCAKHSVALPSKPTLDAMNTELKKQGVYGGNEQKQVTAWVAIRNSAAHAKYGDYTAEQVRLMVQGIRQFISTYPA
jgi:hypothetical protein